MRPRYSLMTERISVRWSDFRTSHWIVHAYPEAGDGWNRRLCLRSRFQPSVLTVGLMLHVAIVVVSINVLAGEPDTGREALEHMVSDLPGKVVAY